LPFALNTFADVRLRCVAASARVNALECQDEASRSMSRDAKSGADDQNRTGDLVLTKDALCQLSYIGPPALNARFAGSFGEAGFDPPRLPSAVSRESPFLKTSASGRACLAVPRVRDSRASEGWSGRRGSNPRPTAWKAVTLPLSYSRLRLLASLRPSVCRARVRFRTLFRFPLTQVTRVLSRTGPSIASTQERSLREFDFGPDRACHERGPQGRVELVAREGLEPSKPLGRQIYSLLRLTASLPRQRSVFWNPCVRRVLCLLSVTVSVSVTCGPQSTQDWSWRRDSNPRPADYKSAALPA
jgi:hypothetical protein